MEVVSTMCYVKYMVVDDTDVTFRRPEDVIRMHPDFRMMVLANRPGFPFLGNDFFHAVGKSLILISCCISYTVVNDAFTIYNDNQFEFLCYPSMLFTIMSPLPLMI